MFYFDNGWGRFFRVLILSRTNHMNDEHDFALKYHLKDIHKIVRNRILFGFR